MTIPFTELVRLTNLKVLESVALDDLREERALGESGEVNKAERIKKGEWKGAEYTFKTTITRFGADQSSFGGSGPLHIPVPCDQPPGRRWPGCFG